MSGQSPTHADLPEFSPARLGLCVVVALISMLLAAFAFLIVAFRSITVGVLLLAALFALSALGVAWAGKRRRLALRNATVAFALPPTFVLLGLLYRLIVTR